MPNAAVLASRFSGRPLLLEPGAAGALLTHLSFGDPRGLQSEGRFEAVLRKLGVGRARAQDAFDDAAEESAANDVRGPSCYAPLWAQQSYGDPQDEGFAWSLYEGVALMECSTAIADRGEEWCGTWYHGYDTLLAGMRESLADTRVNGLFVRLRTPGGVVDGGMYALAAFMRQARAASGGKPIHFHADMACSAGYWIAAQGDRITASPVGLVGSIGAVVVHEDWSEGMKRAGLKVTPIQFGAKKTDGAPWSPLSAAALEDWQSEIDQIGHDFVANVVLGRPHLAPQALIDTQAGVFMAENVDPARSALNLGLIDAVMSEEDAFAELLSRVSPSASSPKPLTSARDAGLTTRADAPPHQETQNPMKKLTSAAPGRAHAEAAPAPTAADPETTECATCDGSGEVNGDPCPDCDGTGEDVIDQGEREAVAPVAAAAPDVAKAIAATPEAKANPVQALAAIEAGLSVEQFKTMAAVAPQAGVNAIDRRMAGARRLGADAAPAPDGKTTLGSALLADAQAKKTARSA